MDYITIRKPSDEWPPAAADTGAATPAKPFDEGELMSELDAILSRTAAAAPTPGAPTATQDADLRLFHDLFAFDDAALLLLVRERRAATAVELHLADRLAAALEALEELEAMLQVESACPVARRRRRTALH